MCVMALAQSYHSLGQQDFSICPAVFSWGTGKGKALQNGASDLGIHETEKGDCSVISF